MSVATSVAVPFATPARLEQPAVHAVVTRRRRNTPITEGQSTLLNSWGLEDIDFTF